MFNYNNFCKQKECPHYKEREHSAGMWKYCDQIGVSFNVVERPSTCPHKEEIDKVAAHELAKAKTWHKLTTVKEPKRESLLDIHNKKYGFL